MLLVPSVIIGAGVLATTDNEVWDRIEIHEERQEYLPRFRTHIDDYLQYAPIAAVYGLNLAEIKSEHDFANRTALMVKSEMMMLAMGNSIEEVDCNSPAGYRLAQLLSIGPYGTGFCRCYIFA